MPPRKRGRKAFGPELPFGQKVNGNGNGKKAKPMPIGEYSPLKAPTLQLRIEILQKKLREIPFAERGERREDIEELASEIRRLKALIKDLETK